MVAHGDWVRIVKTSPEGAWAQGLVGQVVSAAWHPDHFVVEVGSSDVLATEVAPEPEPEETGLSPKPAGSPRAHVLDTAKSLVLGDRNNTYGPPTQDFQRTAGVLNSLGYRKGDGQPLEAHDISVILAAVKLSRLMWSPDKADSWIDLAGYAACGHECVVDNGKDSA